MDLYFNPKAVIQPWNIDDLNHEMAYLHHLINHHKIPASLVAVLTEAQRLKLHSLIHHVRNDRDEWLNEMKRVKMISA